VPAGAQVIVKVSTPPKSVKLSMKDRVMGLFWMTTERAIVENMPTFFALYSSQPVETLLPKEEQVKHGVDAECSGIMAQARATTDSSHPEPLPPEKAESYVRGLRDLYIKEEKYVPCLSCHRMQPGSGAGLAHGLTGGPVGGAVRLSGDTWELDFDLPSDTPLGHYDVTAYYVKDGKVVDSQRAEFSVEKTGLVRTLGTLATENSAVYGVMSLVVLVTVGLVVGLVFPKGGH
jgi:hypothetical protein